MATKKTAKNTAQNEAFSVISTGGKQYIVRAGDKVKVEKIKGEYKVGDAITFSDVLFTFDGSAGTAGTPTVSGAKVQGTITKIARHPKVTVIKYKQKSRYFKKNGHKQPYFEIEIK